MLPTSKAVLAEASCDFGVFKIQAEPKSRRLFEQRFVEERYL